MSIHSSKAPPSNTITLRTGFQYINFGGDTNIQFVVPANIDFIVHESGKYFDVISK